MAMAMARRAPATQKPDSHEGPRRHATQFIVRLSKRQAIILCTAANVVWPRLLYAADWLVTPKIQLRETFSDNIRLAPKGEEESDLVSEVSPGITIVGRGARLQLQADYALKYRAYAKNSRANQFSHDLRSHGLLDVYNRNLFLEASANIAQTEVSTLGARSTSDVNISDSLREVRHYSIGPYWVSRLGTFANAQARYTIDRSESDGATRALDSESQAISLGLSSGPRFNDLGWSVTYYKQEIESSRGRFSKRELESATATASYRVTPTLAALGTVGRDDNKYDSLSGKTGGSFYSVGLRWTPSPRTLVEGEIGERYFGNTGRFRGEHRTRLTTWTLEYSEQIVATPGRFSLPVSLDTAATLDRIFQSSFPDPVERQAVVEAFIVANGLPTFLPSSVDFLTDQVSLSERLQGTVAIRGVRGTLLLTAYHEDRRRESAGETLAGTDPFSLSDKVVQNGYSAVLSWRFSDRTSGTVSVGQSTADHTDANVKDTNSNIRVGLTRQLQPRLRGSVEYRFLHRDRNSSGGDVTENAITGTLSLTF